MTNPLNPNSLLNKEIGETIMKQKQTKTSKAVDTLIKALKADKDYRYGWVANIAVCMQDAYSRAEDKSDIHSISNKGAEDFINLLTK